MRVKESDSEDVRVGVGDVVGVREGPEMPPSFEEVGELLEGERVDARVHGLGVGDRMHLGELAFDLGLPLGRGVGCVGSELGEKASAIARDLELLLHEVHHARCGDARPKNEGVIALAAVGGNFLLIELVGGLRGLWLLDRVVIVFRAPCGFFLRDS